MVSVVEESGIKIVKLVLGPYSTNAYIVISKPDGDSLVIDAPAGADEILRELGATNPHYIAMTHSHIDHIGALSQLKDKLRVPVAAHLLDSSGLPEPVDVDLKDGDYLNVGQLKVKALYTPGHTPGSICFLVGKYLLAGDTIFPGGPGYTLTPADFEQIVQSIDTKILTLPGDTILYPGHGQPTMLSGEKPSITMFMSKPHPPDLHGDVRWL